jgi:hypothetical protein
LAKQAAYGASLKITAGTAVANVTSIKGPGISLDVADVTAHDSANAWEESVATILRSGEVTIDIAYDPAAATIKNASGGLIYNLVQRAKANYTLILGGSSFIFDAWVTKFEPSGGVADALTASVTLKPTGAVTIP